MLSLGPLAKPNISLWHPYISVNGLHPLYVKAAALEMRPQLRRNGKLIMAKFGIEMHFLQAEIILIVTTYDLLNVSYFRDII